MAKTARQKAWFLTGIRSFPAQNPDGFCYRERFRSLYIRLAMIWSRAIKTWSAVAGAWASIGATETWSAVAGAWVSIGATETWSAVMVAWASLKMLARSAIRASHAGPSIRASGASRPVVVEAGAMFSSAFLKFLARLPSIRTSKTRPSRLAVVHPVHNRRIAHGLAHFRWRAIRARLR